MKKEEKKEIENAIVECIDKKLEPYVKKINELSPKIEDSNKRNGFKQTIFTIVMSLMPTIIIAVVGYILRIYQLPGEFNTLNNKVDTYIANNNSLLSQSQSQINELLILKGQFQEFEKNQILSAPTLYPTDNMISIIDVSNKDNCEENLDEIRVISKDAIVAESSDGNNTFTAEQICDQKILMPYEEDGIEVYFVGQLNENLHWNGNCLLNKYDNNDLIFISEATYIDGVLLGYKQAFFDDDKKTWYFSERTVKENGMDGYTIEYSGIQPINKTFDLADVSGKDIITISTFEDNKIISGQMKTYYYGLTSNGNYNDDTGNAYYISFDEDGNVLTLYKGGFVDGHFYDYTGNAWYITRKTKNNDLEKKYDYFKGLFNETAVYEGIYEYNQNISVAEISKIIEGQYFAPILKWYGEES